MELNFRTLKAEEIECRVGTIDEDGFTLLLYKDARCDMNILDEVVGSMNWKREHLRDNSNCIVSIWDNEKGQWVSKEDTGSESNTEKEKGLASDSFKRACVNWGIGRELYTAPFIKIKGNVKKNAKGKCVPCFWNIEVAEIGYGKNKTINTLFIKGDGKIIFTYGEGKPKNELPFPEQGVNVKTPSVAEIKAQRQIELMKLGAEYYTELVSTQWQAVLTQVAKLEGKKFSEMTDEEYARICENIKNRKY